MATESTIALVLTAADLEGTEDPWLQALRDSARRGRAFAERAGTGTTGIDLLARVAQTPPHVRPVPWLELAAGDVLVVPRLASSGQSEAFAREVEGELEKHALPLHWRQPPSFPRRSE
jgi:hypothetical protein